MKKFLTRMCVVMMLLAAFGFAACDQIGDLSPCSDCGKIHTGDCAGLDGDECEDCGKDPCECTVCEDCGEKNCTTDHSELNSDTRCPECGELLDDCTCPTTPPACSEHKDANHDGVCDTDGCNETVTPPHSYPVVDKGNGTHQGTCSCGATTGTAEVHVDNDHNGKCDVCDATVAPPHSYPVVDKGNGTHQGTCSCGATTGTAEAHSDANYDGKCDDCGATVAIPDGGFEAGFTFDISGIVAPSELGAPIVETINAKTTPSFKVTSGEAGTWVVNGTVVASDTDEIVIDVSTLKLGDNVVRFVVGNQSQNVVFVVEYK